MKIAIIGATGMVGKTILSILEERNFLVTTLFPVASENSVGESIVYKGQQHKVVSIDSALEQKPNLAFFSAGGELSKIWAPKFAEIGTTVIDNSSAWRMDKNCPLIVPEINANILTASDKIIANPNCSTIQLAIVLDALNKINPIKRVVVSTYQSVTGTGVKAVNQLENERNNKKGEMVYPYPIDKNCLPHCDVFQENGYTKEEEKIMQESNKILDNDKIKITATAVRVPVVGGHSESVNIEFENPEKISEIYNTLHQTTGITLQDNPDTNTYPMPIFAKNKDDVFVGRIRKDFSQSNTINLWIVSDNLRKGAATNAIQIAEYLTDRKLV